MNYYHKNTIDLIRFDRIDTFLIRKEEKGGGGGSVERKPRNVIFRYHNLLLLQLNYIKILTFGVEEQVCGIC